MLSQTVEYALRAMVYLADHADAQTTPQIAEVTHVPAPYLAKILQSLSRAGLVKSQRGVHGGFSLAKPASETTIWDVVQAVDPIKRIRTCPLELEAHKTKLCPLHKRLDDALAGIEAAFRASTLAELLLEPTTSKPLCPFPQDVERLEVRARR
jgi:Rrf2 family protein